MGVFMSTFRHGASTRMTRRSRLTGLQCSALRRVAAEQAAAEGIIAVEVAVVNPAAAQRAGAAAGMISLGVVVAVAVAVVAAADMISRAAGAVARVRMRGNSAENEDTVNRTRMILIFRPATALEGK